MSKVYHCQGHYRSDFQINNLNLFIHDSHKINFFNFDVDFKTENFEKIGLEVDESETESSIKEIRMSINDQVIMIVIESQDGSVLFKWNMLQNCEEHTHDVDETFKVLWDEKGVMYILKEGGVFFTHYKCNIKAYHYQSSTEIKNWSKNRLGVEKGIKFDNKNHNWLILEEYLAVPFSYMTFVIKKFIESTQLEQRESYTFDPEPYNYILNRSNCFLDGNFVRMDPMQLQHVL